MDYLFPYNAWRTWLLLVVAMITAMVISGLTGWPWLWDDFFYIGSAYITARALYVYWPRKETEGRHSIGLGILALGFSALMLLYMAAVLVFRLAGDDWDTLRIDGIGVAIFLSAGAINIWGATKFPGSPENQKSN